MLDVIGVLELMAEGKPLPQEQFGEITDEMIDILGTESEKIINSLFAAHALAAWPPPAGRRPPACCTNSCSSPLSAS